MTLRGAGSKPTGTLRPDDRRGSAQQKRTGWATSTRRGLTSRKRMKQSIAPFRTRCSCTKGGRWGVMMILRKGLSKQFLLVVSSFQTCAVRTEVEGASGLTKTFRLTVLLLFGEHSTTLAVSSECGVRFRKSHPTHRMLFKAMLQPSRGSVHFQRGSIKIQLSTPFSTTQIGLQPRLSRRSGWIVMRWSATPYASSSR